MMTFQALKLYSARKSYYRIFEYDHFPHFYLMRLFASNAEVFFDLKLYHMKVCVGNTHFHVCYQICIKRYFKNAVCC